MSNTAIEIEPGAAEQFSQGVQSLRELITKTDEREAGIIRQYGSTLGAEVKIPPVETAEALAKLLGVIPGVELSPQSRAIMEKDSNNHRLPNGVRLITNKVAGAYTSASSDVAVTFARAGGLPGVDSHFLTVSLGRTQNDCRISANLRFTEQGGFLGGRVEAGFTRPTSENPRHIMSFDREGKSQRTKEVAQNQVYDDAFNVDGEVKLDVPSILYEITSSQNLTRPIDFNEAVSKHSSEIQSESKP